MRSAQMRSHNFSFLLVALTYQGRNEAEAGQEVTMATGSVGPAGCSCVCCIS